MLHQIALGSVILVFNVAIAALAAFVMERVFLRFHPWVLRPPQHVRLLLLLMATLLWMLAAITVAIWIWAFSLYGLGAFATLEASVYFSIVAFTTLGLGDVVPAVEWRILAAMAAANGFLQFGLLTALLIEALRQVRVSQIDHRHRQKARSDAPQGAERAQSDPD